MSNNEIEHLEACIRETNRKFVTEEWDAEYCQDALKYYRSELSRLQNDTE